MREIARLTLTISVVAGWAQASYAQDSLDQAVMARERANMAHELTICSAYFLLGSQLPGLPDSTRQGLEGQFKLLSEKAVTLSTDAEVYAARFRLAFGEMVNEMDKWDRISVINAKYGLHCKELADAVRVVGPGLQ